MNKNPMFLLPIALIIFLAGYFGFKWWQSQTNFSREQIPESGVIDERGQSLLKNFNLEEKNSVQMNAQGEAKDAYGVVRWSDDKKSLTIAASFEKPGMYQAWMTIDGKTTKIGTLRLEKGGYVLDYTSKEVLPERFTVSVSKETKNDGEIEQKLLEVEVQPNNQ